MAAFALLIWPVVGMALFASVGRARGLIWTVLLGYLFLPSGWTFDLPGLPPLGKRASIAASVLLGVLMTQNESEAAPKTDGWSKFILTALLALLLLSPFVTWLTNRDSVMVGPRWLPPTSFRDLLEPIFFWLVGLVPFLFARRFLHSPEMHRELLKAIVITGLFYSLLALYELRMSPQLNNMVYGFFPHSWLQHIRGGGFRPLVFLGHGLELGLFLLTTVLAAAGLVRASSGDSRALFLPAMLFLFGLLTISRNLGAFAICAVLLPVALMTPLRMHLRIAAIVAVLFVTYPLVRDAYIVPLLGAAERVSAERHESLQFRFNNEDLLVDRAAERPLAGWGTWGRNHVYDEFTGQVLTVTDGLWIIQLGAWGWLGFVGLFGLMIAPLFLMRRAMRDVPLTPVTSAMVLMVTAYIVYMIPNASLSPMVWLVTGALAGFVQYAPGRAGATGTPDPALAEDRVGSDRRRSRYTRFAPRERADARSR